MASIHHHIASLTSIVEKLEYIVFKLEIRFGITHPPPPLSFSPPLPSEPPPPIPPPPSEPPPPLLSLPPPPPPPLLPIVPLCPPPSSTTSSPPPLLTQNPNCKIVPKSPLPSLPPNNSLEINSLVSKFDFDAKSSIPTGYNKNLIFVQLIQPTMFLVDIDGLPTIATEMFSVHIEGQPSSKSKDLYQHPKPSYYSSGYLQLVSVTLLLSHALLQRRLIDDRKTWLWDPGGIIIGFLDRGVFSSHSWNALLQERLNDDFCLLIDMGWLLMRMKGKFHQSMFALKVFDKKSVREEEIFDLKYEHTGSSYSISSEMFFNFLKNHDIRNSVDDRTIWIWDPGIHFEIQLLLAILLIWILTIKISQVLFLEFTIRELVLKISMDSECFTIGDLRRLGEVHAFSILIISLCTTTRLEVNSYQPYGLFIIEIICALVSIHLIWLLVGILAYEANERFMRGMVLYCSGVLPLFQHFQSFAIFK